MNNPIHFLYICVADYDSGDSPQPPPPLPIIDLSNVRIRSYFAESWLFNDNLVDFGYVRGFVE